MRRGWVPTRYADVAWSAHAVLRDSTALIPSATWHDGLGRSSQWLVNAATLMAGGYMARTHT